MRATPKLSASRVEAALSGVPDWTRRIRTIRRTFEFRGFLDAIDFVNRISVRAEKANHHPNIDVRWNKVTLTLSTHDVGGLTEKDFALARQCDSVYDRFE